eukprot:TRINITY_DN2324_c0_g1_i1.p1 TRINITY_DN2324_c0_g1~~TRINITY_DN2324_c0_g1_i1.p1  ORF type:complete len:313 (-),score=81.92 TRINITY_DN2324_c0_g1_i1:66-1004(-)
MLNGEDIPSELAFLADKAADRGDIRVNDSGDEKSDSDDSEHEYEKRSGKQDMSCMIGGMEGEPTKRNTGNTGVKGVLADYAEAKERLREQQAIEKQLIQKMLESKAITISNQTEKKTEEDELDDDDEKFLKEYEEKRLAELRSQYANMAHHNITPTFGFLRQISQQEYLDVIDNERSDIFVVVHLYQKYIQACNKVNQYLSELAPKFNTVKFLKIVSTEAKADFDDIGLPAVLVYRGGELFKMFVPITLELPSLFTCKDIEVLLAKNGIIKSKVVEDHVRRAKFYESVKDNYVSTSTASRHGDENSEEDDDD